jgi:deazaflavin-dependent oxidoreductase (nitroreductase family)
MSSDLDRTVEIVDNSDGWVGSTSASTSRPMADGGHRLSGWEASTLLLVTLGRRSGKLRGTALAYGENDGRYVIVASNGGATRHPDWYLNLVEKRGFRCGSEATDLRRGRATRGLAKDRRSGG